MPRRITMHSQPQRTLKRLIKQYGQELVDDPRRTEALLRDLCGQHTREIFVIINAQRLRVPTELQAAPAWLPYAAIQSRLTRQLQTKLALTEDAADWAVATWAAALDVIPGDLDHSLPWGLDAVLRRVPPRVTRQNAKPGVQSATAPRGPRRRGERAELSWRLPALVWPGWPRQWLRPRFSGLALGAGLAVIALAVLALTWWMARNEPVPVNAEAAATPSNLIVVGDASDAVPPVTLETLALSPPGVYLREAWVLPVYAQVTADGLFVRDGPSVAYRDVAILQARRSVHVVGFSDDGAWSQIDQPRWGWVSNDFLQFESAFGASIRLQVRVLQTKPYAVDVRSNPRAASEQTGELPPGSVAVAVGVTTDDDGQWLQVADPVAGWVAATDVMIVGSP